MRKEKIKVFGLSAVLTVSLLLSACGSYDDNSAQSKYAAEGAYATADTAAYESAPMEMEESYDASGQTGEVVVNTDRKLITTVDLDTETENLDETVSAVDRKVSELGGYIESSNIYNGTSYYGSSSRSANITARIPASKLDLFIDLVEGSTNITRKSVNVDDVTLTYVDIESKRNSLRTEEKRLLDIMKSAETVEDIIAIEDKLADVRYELESIESQLRSYDNLVDYSTVYLNIEEVSTYTPVEKEGAFERIRKGFNENLVAVGDGIVDFIVWVASHLPQIILFIIVVAVVVLIVKLIIAGNKKRRIKKMAMMQARYQGNAPTAPYSPASSEISENGNDGKQ